MKPKPTPQPAALPRARVMYTFSDLAYGQFVKTSNCSVPCSVRPFRTLAAAKRAAKWDNLSEGEKVERVAISLDMVYEKYLGKARHRPTAIGLEAARAVLKACEP